MHTLLPFLLLGFYPGLCPKDSDDYPNDSSTIKEPDIDRIARLSFDRLLVEGTAH
jgi:hypothetical protein